MDLRELATRQHLVVTRDQLDAVGVSRSRLRAEVDGRRWRTFGSRSVVLHNHHLTREQWRWLSVLDPVGPVAVAGLGALEVRGFRFFGVEMQQLHVVVPHGSRPHRFRGVVVHESRRFDPDDVVRMGGLPCTRVERSAIDGAAWQPHARYAAGVLAAVVQQRLTTATALQHELAFVGQVRHKQRMRLTLADVAGGAEALSELDVARLCRRFGLCPPRRQAVRRDSRGRRRYLDCEWDLPDSRVVVLEVDGSHHVLVEHWDADLKRERRVVATRRTVLRASADEVRFEQEDVATDLLAVGVPRVVRSSGRQGARRF